MSAPNKYEGQPADLQPVFWASLGTQKIPIKPRVFGKKSMDRACLTWGEPCSHSAFETQLAGDLENSTTVSQA